MSLSTLLGDNTGNALLRVLFAVIDGEKVRSLYPLPPGNDDLRFFDQAVVDGVITGEGHDVTLLPMEKGKFVVVNCGNLRDFQPDDLRHAAGFACAFLRKRRNLPRTAAISIPGTKDWRFGNDVQLITEGWGLRNDSVKRAPAARAKETDAQLTIVPNERHNQDGIEEQILIGNRIALISRWVREVGNLRGTECPPRVLVSRACAFLKEQLGDKVTFPFGEDLNREFYEGNMPRNFTRFGSFLSVNDGSPEEPAGIYAVYDPQVPGQRTIVLLGKAVTFDTGGFLRKPDSAMNDMFMDKHGAVCTVAEFVFLVLMGVQCKVILSFNATENRDGTLGRDIITSRVGQFIEVNHTDAEGRLTLVDGIDFAVEQAKPDLIIDMATLTGAAVAALGGQVAMFSTGPDPLIRDLFDAIKQSGFGFFPMPISGRQGAKLLAAHEADIVNTDLKRVYGAGSAAWFLAQSLALSNAKHGAQTLLWHLDIAGMMDLKSAEGYQLPGADPGAFIGLAHGLLALFAGGWMRPAA